MIDKQAVETMEQMLALIKKYAENAYPDVATEASQERRRRAWVFTGQLAELARHAANSDLEAALADNVHSTYAKRDECAYASRTSDKAFMLVLREFNEKAAAFENCPIEAEERTDGDVIRCIEDLHQKREVLHARRANLTEYQGAETSKKAAKARSEQLAAIEQKLHDIETKLAESETVAANRGIAVSFNRYRTVIKKIKKPAKKKAAA